MVAQWTLIWHSSKSSNESRRNQKKTGDGLAPDDYRARDTSRVAQFRKKGKKYADSMTISIPSSASKIGEWSPMDLLCSPANIGHEAIARLWALIPVPILRHAWLSIFESMLIGD